MNFKTYFYKIYLETIEDDISGQKGEHHVTAGHVQFWGNVGAGILPYCPTTKRFLLGLRSAYVNEPNTWGLFGGKIDDDENPEDAARRELEEEIGFDGALSIKLIYVFEHQGFKFFNYLGIVDNEFQVTEFDWETKDAKWMKLNEFPVNLHFGIKHLLPHLRKLNN